MCNTCPNRLSGRCAKSCKPRRVAKSTLSLCALGALTAASAQAQPNLRGDEVLGHWLTDDRAMVVELTSCSDQPHIICGYARALPNADAQTKQHAQLLCGLPILADLKFSAAKQRWEGGVIFDPETEQTYRTYLQLNDGALEVHIYEEIELMALTLTWTRAKASKEGCAEAAPFPTETR